MTDLRGRSDGSMEFDPRMTFDTFVVGPANRLASAAARRAAEAPGTTYNPLFLYSASGLGKSHILSAIAHHSDRLDRGRRVIYRTLEGYLDELTRALEKGERTSLKDTYGDADILLLDDVQFLTGQGQAQEMLLRTLDVLTSRKAQVVLASDRPPAEIDGLDERLLSRFSGGLIVDIGLPDYETRVAIMRRKAEERGEPLSPGVAEALARFPFRNVRELQGALNRLLAMQELEGRPVSTDDLPRVMGDGGRDDDGRSISQLLEQMNVGPPERTGPDPDEPGWRRAFRDLADDTEVAGFAAQRLRRYLEREDPEPPEFWTVILDRFQADLDRIREMRRELDALGNPWPEAAAALLRDPDRIEEGEALLASARERARPFPDFPPGPGLEGVTHRYPPLAIRAIEKVLGGERPEFNPLYFHSPDAKRVGALLEAVGRTHLARMPHARVGMISVSEFAEELIHALSDGVAAAWRERWWAVDLLLLHGIEALSFTERAQEEVFHLFETLKRRDTRILIAGDRAPSAINGVDDRLRSRFEGGLVIELGGESAPGTDAPEPGDAAERAASTPDEPDVAAERAESTPDEPDAAAERAESIPDEPEAAELAASIPDEPDAAVGDSEAATTSDGAPRPPESASERPPSEGSPASRASDGPAVDGTPKVPSGSDGPDLGEGEDDLAALRAFAGVTAKEGAPVVRPAEGEPEPGEGWTPSPENVVWRWPRIDDVIVDEVP